jgi:hypothetical protein
MRVFLRAPAADRMLIAPEGLSPGAAPQLASARRQRGPAPGFMLCAANRLDNSMANNAANKDEAGVLAAHPISLTAECRVLCQLQDEGTGLILQLH